MYLVPWDEDTLLVFDFRLAEITQISFGLNGSQNMLRKTQISDVQQIIL